MFSLDVIVGVQSSADGTGFGQVVCSDVSCLLSHDSGGASVLNGTSVFIYLLSSVCVLFVGHTDQIPEKKKKLLNCSEILQYAAVCFSLN